MLKHKKEKLKEFDVMEENSPDPKYTFIQTLVAMWFPGTYGWLLLLIYKEQWNSSS